MMQLALLTPVDSQHDAAQWIWTDHSRICAHPVIWVRRALFCRQQRDCGLQGIQAEGLPWWEVQLTADQLEVLTHLVVARALAADFFNRDFKIE